MKCNHCQNNFPEDQIDLDGSCYDCANLDPDYKLDTTELVKELVASTVENLAVAKKTSAEKLKADLVSEHVYNNPEKYIEQFVTSVPSKKSNKENN